MRLQLGARGSALSRAQASLIVRALDGLAEVAVRTVRTTGDRLSAAGSPIEWKGDFTRELDEQLLAGQIDLAVHSMKDVPIKLPEGLVIAAVPLREDPSDVLVSRDGSALAALAAGARIGTSSPRRRAQILACRPQLVVADARGNVDTRLRRLAEGKWDALVLARAGLARLGRLDAATEVLSEFLMLPAPGQGALAVVAREGREDVLGVLRRLDDPDSRAAILAERAVAAGLDAGCRTPLAALGHARNGRLRLSAAVLAPDGSRALRAESEAGAEEAADLGARVAAELLSRGAAELIAESRP